MNLIHLSIGDPFHVAEQMKPLLQKIQSQYKNASLTHFRLSETGIEEILKLARSLPFLADAQIFVIREAELLKEKQTSMIAAYLENPLDKSFLILECESLEKSHPLRALIEKKGKIYQSGEQEKQTQSGRFVKEKLASYGKTIAPPALERLQAQMGDAPVFLDSVVEQMALYAGDKKEIDEEIVEKFEERWRETDIFQLANAIGSRKTSDSIRLLREMGAGKESEMIALVGFFHWQFRRLWEAALKLERGEPQDSVLRDCKVYPKQAPFFLRQLRSYSRKKLEEILEGLFQLDWKMKSGQINAGYGIEAWVIEATT